jgi:hypothetical protein
MSTDRVDSADSSQPLTSGQRASLDIVLDMIVPPSADGRMPGAAEVGVPAYVVAATIANDKFAPKACI